MTCYRCNKKGHLANEYSAQIDYKSKRVCLRSKNGMKVVFKGQKQE